MEKENSTTNDNPSAQSWKAGSILFVGCMFLGIGIGRWLGSFLTGLYIGMGVGFLVMGTIHLMQKDKARS